MQDQQKPQKRHRTKPDVAKSRRRDVFLYQKRIVNRSEARGIIKELIHRGIPHIRIREYFMIKTEKVYQGLIEEIVEEQQNSDISKPMFAIISEHPFKKDLADDQIMSRLQGPWLHASHLDDTGMDSILKKVVEMGDGYGWIRIVKIVTIDQKTLVDNNGVLI